MSALSRRSMIAGAALSVPFASAMVYADAHADEVQGGITPQNHTKNYINLLSNPQVKADGSQDCTQAINDAVRTLASAGGGALEIPAGKYRVSAPFIQLLDRVEIFGHGKATQIIAHPGGGLVQKDEDEAECVGVFHVGSYLVAGPEKPKPGDKGANQWFSEAPMRFGVRDLVIRTNADNVRLNRDDPYSRARHTPIMKGVAGVILHTYYANKNYRPEPEAVATLENLEIWDTDMGVAILGLHDRAMKVHDIRVRMTWRQGFLVGKPIGHKAICWMYPMPTSVAGIMPALRSTLRSVSFHSQRVGITTGIRLENRCISRARRGSHITHMQVRLVQAGMLRQAVICLSDALLKKMGVMAG